MASIVDSLSDARRHLEAGQLDRAIPLLREVLQHAPTHFEALCLLGLALKQRGDLGEAESRYGRALEIRPSSGPAWMARGTILHQLGRDDEAADCFTHALTLDPSDRGACIQLGNLLFARDPEAGLRLFERAFEIDPTHATSRTCLTLGLVAVGALHSAREEWDAMFAAYRRALEIDASHAGAHFNLSVELLRHGRLAEGWREYEWRWQWKGFADRPRNFTPPQWRGEALAGARILLHAEQGFGDAIQFARYAPLVAERGGTVFLEVDRQLVQLLGSMPGVSGIIARGDALPAFDWHCPLMSLPLAFGTTLETIPSRIPYVAAARMPLESDTPNRAAAGMRIGLVWAGNPTHLRDEGRSIALDLFEPLTQTAGTRWYSLQKGPAALSARPAAINLVDLAPRIRDFADTAALIDGLDLVITVDTAVAHLAGAMGTPVWILVRKPSDWRWMLDRDDSPWYATARLFRQETSGQWAPVIERVHQALRGLMASRADQA